MKIATWYNRIGFYNNPFSIKPAAFSDELFGFKDKVTKLIKDIEEGDFYLITGAYGNGKTTMLKRVVNNFRGKKVIYYNYVKNKKEIDFDRLLTGMNFFRRMLDTKRKGNILLLDEVQDINEEDLKNIGELSEQGYLKSVIFVSPDSDMRITAEIKKKIGSNKIDLGNISKKVATELVRERIGKLKLLPDKMIAKIFKIDKNPRNFLRNCEDACRYAVENNIKKVNEETIRKALK
jgi:KaiC/GvpD/RAD55 family RecA-like ATPase